MTDSLDWQLGIHANIPTCCIEFFCRRSTTAIMRLNQRRGLYADKGVQYVMCTTCLRRFRTGAIRAARLHICRRASDHPLCALTLGQRLLR